MGTQVPPVPALDAIPVSVAQGGTASTTPSAARTVLGLAIGSDVNAYNAFATAMDQSVANGAAPVLAATNFTGLPASGSTVTLPTVIGSRWTDTGLLDGLAFADYNATEDGTATALVASPGDAVQYNTAQFATLKATAGVITARPLATGSSWDWYTGPTYTAGCNFWPMGGRGFFEAHVGTADGANMGGMGNASISLIVRPTGALGNPRKFLQAHLQMGASKGCGVVQYNGFNATDNGAITPAAGDADTGYWFRFEIDFDGTARVYRIAGAAGARPALHTYIPIIRLPQFFALNVTIGADTHVDKSLEAGLIAHTSASTSTGTNDNFIVSGLRIGRSLVTTVQ